MTKDILAMYVILVVCVMLALFFASYRTSAEIDERERIDALELSDVDIPHTPDGVYYGECSSRTTSARVRVRVKDGRATDVELLEHDTQRGRDAEIITEVIVARQSLDVDAVTGATLSSKVIVKACERALSSARLSCPYYPA